MALGWGMAGNPEWGLGTLGPLTPVREPGKSVKNPLPAREKCAQSAHDASHAPH